MEIQEILSNPPSDLLTEIGKEIATDRMRSGELGKVISLAQDREQTRKIVDQLWSGTDETAAKQRANYTSDARTSLSVLAIYLKKNDKPFKPFEIDGKWTVCEGCSSVDCDGKCR